MINHESETPTIARRYPNLPMLALIGELHIAPDLIAGFIIASSGEFLTSLFPSGIYVHFDTETNDIIGFSSHSLNLDK